MNNILTYINIRDFSKTKRIHFFINIIIGIAIAVFFHFVERTVWGEDTINSAFDWFIEKEARIEAKNVGKSSGQRVYKTSDKILFVEIDHAVYKKWGTPAITPRNEIAKIIEAAYKGGAAIIVLDILLEDKDCCRPENDSVLRKVLQEMIDEKATTKIIFPARIRFGGEIQKSLFGDMIENSPNFYSASPTFSATSKDKIIRYWNIHETFKENGDDRILWNASFLAAMLANGKIRELKNLEKAIYSQNFHPEKDDLYKNRIRFLLVPKKALLDYPGGSLFQSVCSIDEVPYADFRNKIVIIGNSSPDAGDMYPTPAGNMAGMFIHGNSINTILLGLQPSRPPMIVNILIEVLIIIMASYLFLYFQSLAAQILGSIILVLTLGVVSYYYFLYTGIFLNFVFAVIGMGFHKNISNIEKIFIDKGKNIIEH